MRIAEEIGAYTLLGGVPQTGQRVGELRATHAESGCGALLVNMN
jgi:hypothetical protein